MGRPSLVSPGGITPVSDDELAALRSGGTVTRSLGADHAWDAFRKDWEAYCGGFSLDDRPHWVSVSGQLLGALFADTEFGGAFAAASAFADAGLRAPVLDFGGAVALFGPSHRTDPALVAIRAGRPEKGSCSADEALCGVRESLRLAKEWREAHPRRDRYEACDIVLGRSRHVALEITQHLDGDSVTGFAVSEWQETTPLPPHLAEWVARLETEEGAEWL